MKHTIKFAYAAMLALGLAAGLSGCGGDKSPYVDLLRYAGKANAEFENAYGPKFRIWGWAKNGLVAYSSERSVAARGGVILRFRVFDFVDDKKVAEFEMDSFDHGDATVEELYALCGDRIKEALAKHGIAETRADFLPFPIKKGGAVYEAHPAITSRNDGDAWGQSINGFSVVVTKDGRTSRTIATSRESAMALAVCGYFLSPFENRALVVTAVKQRGFDGPEVSYLFSGCHLEIGF